jgi:hypothetical protein
VDDPPALEHVIVPEPTLPETVVELCVKVRITPLTLQVTVIPEIVPVMLLALYVQRPVTSMLGDVVLSEQPANATRNSNKSRFTGYLQWWEMEWWEITRQLEDGQRDSTLARSPKRSRRSGENLSVIVCCAKRVCRTTDAYIRSKQASDPVSVVLI